MALKARAIDAVKRVSEIKEAYMVYGVYDIIAQVETKLCRSLMRAHGDAPT